MWIGGVRSIGWMCVRSRVRGYVGNVSVMCRVLTMAENNVGVEMAVWWWAGVSEPGLVVEPDSVVESSPLVHCTGCIDVLAVVLSVYEL